jgi:hypothetical protein
VKFAIPSVFTFEGNLVDCNFNVNVERKPGALSQFTLVVAGHLHIDAAHRPFRAGSTLVVNPQRSLVERVDIIIARIELLLPASLAPRCRLLLQDELTIWMSSM